MPGDDPDPWWRDDWKNDGLDDPWFDDDPEELAHRELNRRLMRDALVKRYPTCPCPDPACTGGAHS